MFAIQAVLALEGALLPEDWRSGKIGRRVVDPALAVGRSWDGPGPAPDSVPPPTVSPCGRFTLLFQGRLDDESGLAERLGSDATASSVALLRAEALVMAAYMRWGPACIGRILGAWTALVWDGRERRLHLLRDGMGEGLLHWRRHEGCLFVDSNLPRLVHELLPRPRLDPARLHDLLLLNFRLRAQHVFHDMGRVAPGHCLSLGVDGVMESQAVYHPLVASSRLDLSAMSEVEAIEAMTEALRRAVLRRVPAEGPVSFHLSSGMDSGSICAVLHGEPALRGRLHAFAMAPIPGGRTACPPDRVFDEMPAVRALAAHCGDLPVEAIPYGHEPYLERIRASRPTQGGPNMLSFNHAWYDEITAAVARIGGRVVLAGFRGNFSYSHSPPFPGPLQLFRLRRADPAYGLRACFKGLLRGMLNLFPVGRGATDFDWRVLSAVSEAAARATGAFRRKEEAATIPDAMRPLRRGQGAWRRSEQILGMSFWQDYFEGLRLQHGVATLDPFMDRELAELSLAMLDRHWLAGDRHRGLAHGVWKELLPDHPPYGGPRGYQTSNWVERLHRSLPALRGELARWKGSERVGQVVDVDRLERALDAWEAGSVEPVQAMSEYYHVLGRGAAMADFILYWEGQP